MALYIGLTIWFLILSLLGLRPDSIEAAENWPKPPEGKMERMNQIIVFILALLSFLLLWFLTAFRSSEIGNDTNNYLYYFDIFTNGIDLTRRAEIGYQFFVFFIGKFTRDQHAFLIITASVMYCGIGVYLFKYSKNPAVSLCLFFSFFFSVYINILRQCMAMMIALYGYQLLKSGKKTLAALLFLMAMCFHTTAIVCFLLFLDLKILEKRWVVFSITLLCAAVSFSGILKSVVDVIFPKYSTYFKGQYASSGWVAVTCYLLVYFALYVLVTKSLIPDCKPDKVVAANFTFLLLLTAFGYAVNLFERASEYFMLIATVEFPNILYRGKVKNFRLWVLGICIAFLAMFLVTLILRPGWSKMCPYEFWH